MTLPRARQVQDASHFRDLRCDIRRHVHRGKADDRNFRIVLRALDTDLKCIGTLQLVEQLGEAGELRVAGPGHARPPGFVGYAIDRIDGDRHDHGGGVSRLQQEQHGGRRNGRHQLLDEVVPAIARMAESRSAFMSGAASSIIVALFLMRCTDEASIELDQVDQSTGGPNRKQSGRMTKTRRNTLWLLAGSGAMIGLSASGDIPRGPAVPRADATRATVLGIPNDANDGPNQTSRTNLLDH